MYIVKKYTYLRTVNFLSIILSIYIIVTSVSPCCCDYDVFDLGNQTEQHDTGNLPHDDCAGVCSPFCLCTACAGCMAEPAISYYQTELLKIAKEVNVYPTLFYSLPLFKGIWQPPK
ncbi:MAG: hypothetical protein LBV57_00390 [Candidatus Symbiothrix sp.]|nr:hypothetical protein [Candidatus Symbiothrix sp.]